jgi:F0F1-type ATP synthase epsilon subunit
VKISITDCSCEKLIKIARQCGFFIYEGKKHVKIKTRTGQFITIIPRHNRLKKEIVKGIVKAFENAGGNVSY